MLLALHLKQGTPLKVETHYHKVSRGAYQYEWQMGLHS